jgi:trigger factor
MKVEFVEETTVRKALEFEIESDEFKKEIDRCARDYSRRLRLPGFRPGKVPLEVVKMRFKRELFDEAAETIIKRVVPREIEGRGLKPIGRPHVTDIHADENRPLTFRAVFEIPPLVELPEYRDLTARVRQPKVSEEDVDRALGVARERAARYEPVDDRCVNENDFVSLDLWWKSDDGVRHHEENAMIHVNETANHPDLTRALVGTKVGENKSQLVHYSPDHPSRSLAGHKVEYTFTLKAIKRQVLPEVDDEFARDLGYDSLNALRVATRERLLAEDQERVNQELTDALLDALIARVNIEVPETMIENGMSLRTERAVRALQLSGVDPQTSGIDWRAYRESQREAAKRTAKADLLLDEIARRESIEAPPSAIDSELARLAEQTKTHTETLRRRMHESGDLAALADRLRRAKTLDLLRSNARLIGE